MLRTRTQRWNQPGVRGLSNWITHDSREVAAPNYREFNGPFFTALSWPR